jgi:CRISPR-associated endonuclease Csn1
MSKETVACEYTLGLDLGSASIGWALIRLDSNHSPCNLLDAGVRIFEPGVEGNIEEGKDESKALARRTARLQRRQLRRRAARQRELFRLLQAEGLLPSSDSAIDDFSLQRHEILNRLDKELLNGLKAHQGVSDYLQAEQLLPYVLRKEALERKLEAHELGRALYHLCQRRGFKSNRREGGGKEKEEELGKVKQDISTLRQEMGEKTLGAYFAGLDPHLRRVRQRWTARDMFEKEFEAIWERQSREWPELLSVPLKAEVARLLYFQRSIAKQEHLIGHCELEKTERRAPWASLDAQRFRLLQKVNDLKIIPAGSFDEVCLTGEQRHSILEHLEVHGGITFGDLKKLFGLPPRTHFNLERGGEKSMPGNRTNAHMLAVFGEQWRELAAESKNEIVEMWRREESEEKLTRYGQERWALDEYTAKLFAGKSAEDKYCNLSLTAIRKLLPIMEEGVAFMTARTALYPEQRDEPRELLPLVKEAVPELRNPAVERALTEVRKVVNAILRKYGKPYSIRIEMARELRKPRKEREAAAKRMRQNEKERIAMKARILKEAGLPNPSRDDIERARLWEECGGICPYTGRTIEFSSLFGRESQFDVEHIIPLSRCVDDSFGNKTLCYHEENRHVKRNQTPWEAYEKVEERWNDIIQRVKSWKGGNAAKLRRFELKSTEELEGFSARQMNDTRYTTRLAIDLLKTLYGGLHIANADGSIRQAIFASSGMVTATLRKVWGLEGILREVLPSANGENHGKPRTDHRHHAIDAITIALSSSSTIQRMNAYAAMASARDSGTRVFRGLQSPWPDFVDSIRPRILAMRVSHRPEHKMSGALHNDTLYGRPYVRDGKSLVHLRRSVKGIKPDQIANIADTAVRAAVEKRLAEHGGDVGKFNPEIPESLPYMESKRGRIPIKKVRVKETKKGLLELKNNRFVELGDIHHFELFVQRDENRRESWTHVSVSLMEASQRNAANRRDGEKRSVVSHQMKDDTEAEFLFSLMKGDIVEMDYQGGRELFRVKKFYAAGRTWFAHVNNAQKDADQKRDGTCWAKPPNGLMQLNARKVTIDLLGHVHPVHD